MYLSKYVHPLDYTECHTELDYIKERYRWLVESTAFLKENIACVFDRVALSDQLEVTNYRIQDMQYLLDGYHENDLV